MILTAILRLLFAVVKLPFEIIDLPSVPSELWDNIEVIHSYLSDGYALAQYFFAQNFYELYINVFIALIVAKPTILLFNWLYHKLRG